MPRVFVLCPVSLKTASNTSHNSVLVKSRDCGGKDTEGSIEYQDTVQTHDAPWSSQREVFSVADSPYVDGVL